MKLLKKNFNDGFLDLIVDTEEDLWYLAEMIKEGDSVRGSATRKIKVGHNQDATIKKTFTVTIRVENVSYDVTALRVNGIVLVAPEEVPRGSHQNITAELGSRLSITKEYWSRLDREKIEEAQEQHKDTLLILVDRTDAVMVMLKKRGYETALTLRGEARGKQYQTASKDFFKELAEQLLNVVTSAQPHTIIIAASSFWHDELKKNLRELETVLNKKLIFVSYANSGREKDIEGLFTSKELGRLLDEERIGREIRNVEDALERLAKRDRIAYGLKEVSTAATMGAVETLLISEKLLLEKRMQKDSKDQGDRNHRELEDLLHTVEKMNGAVQIIRSNHDAGKRLKSLGGVLALLRYDIT